MALSRRQVMLALSLGMGLACAPGARQPGDSTYLEIAKAGPTDPASPTIVVFMPATVQTREVWAGLADELGRDYRLIAVAVEDSNDAPRIAEAFRLHHPVGLVLMNNPTAAAYRQFQIGSGLTSFPPAVIVMASFLDGHAQQLRAATGISYEIPLITAVTNLRRVLVSPIETVGVVVRAPLRPYVERQAALSQREQISVLIEEVSSAPNASELKRALRRVKRSADALWVPNDDRLLSPRLITDAWLPGLNERPFRPTMVGAASLVSPLHSFGTFAVLPDHTALGVQTANLLLDIADNGWRLAADAEVQLPLSTTVSMDRVQAEERFALRPDARSRVDRIIE